MPFFFLQIFNGWLVSKKVTTVTKWRKKVTPKKKFVFTIYNLHKLVKRVRNTSGLYSRKEEKKNMSSLGLFASNIFKFREYMIVIFSSMIILEHFHGV